MAKRAEKTNAMRMLDRLGIAYEAVSYPCEEFLDGVSVADLLGQPHGQVYKTLVTTGKSGEHYVFVLPVAEELDRKKAAAAYSSSFRRTAFCRPAAGGMRIF